MKWAFKHNLGSVVIRVALVLFECPLDEHLRLLFLEHSNAIPSSVVKIVIIIYCLDFA